ncbi:MAG TPA: PLP-dependent aminotransferase family protein [Humisphaera sp.]|jgi:2-aminoadipate transaminase|nr:PLP-dependent aminotransferase family protein [Humisphaera sp.]
MPTTAPSSFRFARRTERLRPSAIREILKATELPDVISFAGGLPAPELFPVDDFARAAQEVLSEDRSSAMQYSTTEGYPPLRQWVCEHLAEAVNLRCSPEQILITNGSQQALDLVAKVLIDPGDIVLVENPAYLGALQAFDAYEANVVGVRSDDAGIDTFDLRRVIAQCPQKPKLLYLIPNFQNPTGVSMSLERRSEVAKIAAEQGIPILEDDPYGRLRYAGSEQPAIAALPQTRNCIYTGTSSKIMAPGMRVAWLVVPEAEVYEKLIPAKQAADLHTSTFTQRIVWRYARRPGVLEAHIKILLESYRRRRDAMLESLTEHMPQGCTWTHPDGGLFLWVRVPESIDTLDLLRAATARKVAFVPGQPFWVGGNVHNTMRLNFSNATEQKIREGIRRLGEALAQLAQSPAAVSV